MLQALHNSDSELRREREKNASRFKIGPDGTEVNEFEAMHRRIDELTCENRLLSKSVEEAEKRALSMQNSLVTTEESLRRLVEAVKSGKANAAQQQASMQAQQGGTAGGKSDQTGSGMAGDSGLTNIRIDRLESDRNEIERLREQLNEAFHRESEAEKALIECEMSRNQLKEVSLNSNSFNFKYLKSLKKLIISIATEIKDQCRFTISSNLLKQIINMKVKIYYINYLPEIKGFNKIN